MAFSPQIAFTINLMELIHSLILECQVSLYDTAKMVGMLSPLHQDEVCFKNVCMYLNSF